MARQSRNAMFAQFAQIIEDLKLRGGLPGPDQVDELWDQLWFAEAHNSTAIEGNTLVLKEVKTLLVDQIPIGKKELKEYMEVLGYAEASKWVYSHATAPKKWVSADLITITEIRNVHQMALSKVWDVAPHPDAYDSESPGSFREHDIQAFSNGMKPPTFPLVPEQLSSWVDFVNQVGAGFRTGLIHAISLPEIIAEIHVRFEKVHPFLDGNGRTGRLLLNLILIRLGLAPAIIYKRHRKQYIDSLIKADDGSFGQLSEVICRSVIQNYQYLLSKTSEDEELLPLEALVSKDFNIYALRKAIARNRIVAAIDEDGKYRSTKKAVQEYLQSRRHTR